MTAVAVAVAVPRMVCIQARVGSRITDIRSIMCGILKGIVVRMTVGSRAAAAAGVGVRGGSCKRRGNETFSRTRSWHFDLGR